ncbi:MAG: aspartyl/asparaginyl beta-hydroxylase domain-containing protein [Acidimicrobiales bacterium]
MSRVEDLLGSVVVRNNERMRVRATDRFDPNPRDLAGVEWNRRLEAAWPDIRSEWDAFAASGSLPLIEDVIGEHQGNVGEWRAGLLVSRGRPATQLAERFPLTLVALGQVPGLWSALFSVLDAGAELPEHEGPNAGVLRYHLGVDCGQGAALEVEGTAVPYRDGVGILFDDTRPHAAWNRGPEPRVTLFLEVLRPTSGAAAAANAAVQRLIALDPRYRRAPAQADRLTPA